MKKCFVFSLLIALTCLLCGCTNQEDSDAQNSSSAEPVIKNEEKDLIQETKEALTPYLEPLGTDCADGTLSVSHEFVENVDSVKIMGRTGSVVHGMSDNSPTQISIMRWEDNASATEDEFDTFLDSLQTYFGKPEEGVKAYDNMSEETHVWIDESCSSYVPCWYDGSTIFVEWHYDSTLQTHDGGDDITTSDTENSTSAKTSFTNRYGTRTTICAHPGCTNYIASSGDTNCCEIHSNRCISCGAYIDEDASWCLSCLEKPVGGGYSEEKHSCEECGKEASHSIDGLTGRKEYYCTEHYNDMKDMLSLIHI